jgi:magnesium transporter
VAGVAGSLRPFGTTTDADPSEALTREDLRDAWPVLSMEDKLRGFSLLPSQEDQEEFFLAIPTLDQAKLLLAFPPNKRRSWIRLLAPDDTADLIQAAPAEERAGLIALLDEPTRKEVNALLAYAEDAAGGLMSTRFARVRPEMTVDEAIGYLRKQARGRLETLYYVYVLDEQQRLLGVVSLRELFASQPSTRVRDVMHVEVLKVRADQDQESVSRVFQENDLVALPVVDADNRIQGIVTVDDIVDVVQEEATEDIQKIGGMEALDEPYLSVALGKMVKKRAGWLAALFLGEMLTASAMAHFQDQIARAVVLALFVPLIISSGGNSGSQATTLVIRAMALGEVRLRDWWWVVRREIAAGLTLGLVLGTIGFLRIVVWQAFSPLYGPHYLLIAVTVGGSLLGVVTFGTVVGSLLPFILKRLGFDPASASAPFVATLVDVTGLVIYFTLASILLHGTLL